MSRYGDGSKKEFINEQLDYISYELYGKDWYDLSAEDKIELTGVILSILADNTTSTYDNDFEEPMFKEELEDE